MLDSPVTSSYGEIEREKKFSLAINDLKRKYDDDDCLLYTYRNLSRNFIVVYNLQKYIENQKARTE